MKSVLVIPTSTSNNSRIALAKYLYFLVHGRQRWKVNRSGVDKSDRPDFSGERISYLDRVFGLRSLRCKREKSLVFPVFKQWRFWTLPMEDCRVFIFLSHVPWPWPWLGVFIPFDMDSYPRTVRPLFLVVRGKIVQATHHLTMSTGANKVAHLLGAVRPSQEHAGAPVSRMKKSSFCVKEGIDFLQNK